MQTQSQGKYYDLNLDTGRIKVVTPKVKHGIGDWLLYLQGCAIGALIALVYLFAPAWSPWLAGFLIAGLGGYYIWLVRMVLSTQRRDLDHAYTVGFTAGACAVAELQGVLDQLSEKEVRLMQLSRWMDDIDPEDMGNA